jgi:phenylacetate-CoA ligase
VPEGPLFEPDIQTMPREALLALQEERLRETVARAFEVPFWNRKLAEAGLGPDDVKTRDDLLRVPRTVKDELRASQASSSPFGDYVSRTGAVRVGTTTGTTGTPSLVLWTKRDLETEHRAAARMFWRQGVRPGFLVAHSHPLGVYGGGALLSSALEAFGCLVMAVGSPATDQQAEEIVRLFELIRPDMYIMFDAALLRLWEAAQRLGLDPQKDLKMRLRTPHPAMQGGSATAGAECFSFMGGACAEFKGAHLTEDLAVVECIDPATGLPASEGRRGHLVVTTLERDNPMLRYDLEDFVRIDTSPCPCGETHARMIWDGRAKDVVTVHGKALLPVDVWWVLEEFPELKSPTIEFVIVRRPANDTLTVRVEGDDTPPGEIAALLQEKLGVPADAEVVARGALGRSAFKPVRVVDEP